MILNYGLKFFSSILFDMNDERKAVAYCVLAGGWLSYEQFKEALKGLGAKDELCETEDLIALLNGKSKHYASQSKFPCLGEDMTENPPEIGISDIGFFMIQAQVDGLMRSIRYKNGFLKSYVRWF